MVVMPGLVNAHLHITDTPFTRGWFEDYEDGAQANHTGLYHLLPTIRGSVAIEDERVSGRGCWAPTSPSTSLRRPDLGRLALGCRADIVLVDANTPHAVPMRDPFTFLVYSANASDVHTVIIQGRTVVRDRQVLTTDVPAALDRMREAGTRVRARFSV